VDLRATNGEWVGLGEYAFDQGDAAVTITNDADGNVLADAVKLVPLP
jgi:hypothetical protein